MEVFNFGISDNKWYFRVSNSINEYFYFQLEPDDFCCCSYNLGSFDICLDFDKYKNDIIKSLKNFFKTELISDSYDEQRTNILCTMTNPNYIDILKKVGFNTIGEFKNCKTGNTVYIMQYIIDHGFEYNDGEEYDD